MYLLFKNVTTPFCIKVLQTSCDPCLTVEHVRKKQRRHPNDSSLFEKAVEFVDAFPQRVRSNIELKLLGDHNTYEFTSGEKGNKYVIRKSGDTISDWREIETVTQVKGFI